MASNPTKKFPSRKKGRPKAGGVRAVRIRIKKPGKISSSEIERAIEKRLAPTKTDVFGTNDTLIILLEDHGNKSS
jgi:hypothetical protein